MSQSLEVKESKSPKRRKTRRRWVWRAAGLVVVGAGCYWYFHKTPEAVRGGTTFVARRGPLVISVLEGGSVDALESQDAKSEVQGQTKILSIVDEGYSVTQEDVDNGKVLVELDSKDLMDKQLAQELEYQNSVAAFTEAKEEYEIQVNQNRSDILTAALLAKFARMDFQKYLGVNAAKEILAQVGVPDVNFESAANDAGPETAVGRELFPALQTEDIAEDPPKDEKPAADAEEEMDQKVAHPPVDFTKYANSDLLGDGEARQKLRTLEDAEVLAKKEVGLSETQFEGTKRLAEKNFVTSVDLENDRLKVQRNEIALQSAQTSKELFINYEFLKESEKRLSDYEEGLRKLERAKKLAVSKLAQADAKRKSSNATFELRAKNRRDIQEQIEKCKIKAKRVGLVVYNDNEGWRGEDRIQEGATVRERQKIITIPDMTQLAVKVKIHEAAIKRIEKGQKAKIIIDAYPEEELTGEVVKIGVLPDANNRWMNPDLKVYETNISIDGMVPWLKPGLSAQVEIRVKELADVVYVPIQAVTPSNDERVCFVVGLAGPTRRVVETGEFNNEFIEIKKGIGEGERVLLRAPVVPEEADKNNGQEKSGKTPKKSPVKDKAPAAAKKTGNPA